MNRMKLNTKLVAVCLAGIGAATIVPLRAQDAGNKFQTQYARLQIDGSGFITSLVSLSSGNEYSPAGHPSPLLSLHEYGKTNDQLLFPTSASFDTRQQEFTLQYSNGATAVVKAAAREDYFRFQLVSLTPRGDVDNIVWGRCTRR